MNMEGGGAGGRVKGRGRRGDKCGREEKERLDEKKTTGRIPNIFDRDVLPYMFTACPYSSLLSLPERIC
jgi:hypothetical protein